MHYSRERATHITHARTVRPHERIVEFSASDRPFLQEENRVSRRRIKIGERRRLTTLTASSRGTLNSETRLRGAARNRALAAAVYGPIGLSLACNARESEGKGGRVEKKKR